MTKQTCEARIDPDDALFLVNDELFCCPQNLMGCVTGVLERNEYLFPDLPEVRDTKRVVDIGANVGSFVRWFDAIRPGQTYDCYEPHPGARAYLQRNVGSRDVRIHPFAVAAGPERAIDLYEGTDWGLNTLEPTFRATDTKVSVRTVAPEMLPPCDVLKIDAEGVEREIVEAYPYLDRVKMVLLEWHREEDKRAIEDACLKAGLRCFAVDQLLVSSGRMIWLRSPAKFSYRVGGYVRSEDWP